VLQAIYKDKQKKGDYMKYVYEVEEYSQDSRHYKIESNVKLTESQINEAYCEVDLVDGYTSTFDLDTNTNVTVTFEGTEYGDDSQVNITGDYKQE
tara:strand:+ start:211 stop:495 length:285 start_codon:yes stop_codon:yes gene_type:complete